VYLATIFFSGPLSSWSGKPHPREILAIRRSRWKWLAIAKGASLLRMFDSGRCGFVVLKGNEIVHREHARDPVCNPLPGEPLHELMQ
jgi:hypothetical protein